MNTTVRNHLIEVARKRGIIHYQELCNACNLKLNMHDNPSDRLEIGRILGEISVFEHNEKRPLISAIVVSKGTLDEGNGFYKLCEELGITSDWRRLAKDDTFAIREISKCHDFWSNTGNYDAHR